MGLNYTSQPVDDEGRDMAARLRWALAHAALTIKERETYARDLRKLDAGENIDPRSPSHWLEVWTGEED